jgi:hypothetical protein
MIHFGGLNGICQTASTPWPPMTAQVSDSILIDGDIHALCVLPLQSLFKVMPTPPHFESPHTANWRGYVASWKIENDRLWLMGLEGRLQNKQHSITDNGTPEQTENPKEYHQNTISRIETLPLDRFGIRQSDENWFGHLIDDDNGIVDLDAASRIKLDELFRSDETPVHAAWYSGLLRIPSITASISRSASRLRVRAVT